MDLLYLYNSMYDNNSYFYKGAEHKKVSFNFGCFWNYVRCDMDIGGIGQIQIRDIQ